MSKPYPSINDLSNELTSGERKPKDCIYPQMHRCKGCEYNAIPELSDGGCLLISKALHQGIKFDDIFAEPFTE